IEGTGDLHFKDSAIWNPVKHSDCSYQLICAQAPVVLNMYMIRRYINALARKGSRREKRRENYKKWLKEVFIELDNIAKNHEYTLVVCWKDLKGTIDFSEENALPLTDRDGLIAEEDALKPYLEREVQKYHPGKFIFTHYQS